MQISFKYFRAEKIEHNKVTVYITLTRKFIIFSGRVGEIKIAVLLVLKNIRL